MCQHSGRVDKQFVEVHLSQGESPPGIKSKGSVELHNAVATVLEVSIDTGTRPRESPNNLLGPYRCLVPKKYG